MLPKFITFNLTTKLPEQIYVPSDPSLAILGVVGDTITVELSETNTDNGLILDTYHWAGSEIGFHEPKVNPIYIWDAGTLSYIEPPNYIDIKKLEKTNAIDLTRSIKNLLPIIYQDTVWDANQIAQNNIQGKLVEISSKQILNIVDANLFWKDTANVIHTWSTMDEYLLWLRGLAIAIAERTTNLYTIAWTKKAEVEALLTVTDVVTYDTNIGF